MNRSTEPRRGGAVGAGLRRPVVVDALVAAIATGVAMVHMVTASEAGARPPDHLGLLLLAVSGGLLLVRRRWPAGVLVAVIGVTYVYLVQEYPGGAELPLLMVGFFTVMAEGKRVIGALVLSGVMATSVMYRLQVDGDDPAVVIATASLLAMAALLGDATRARRDLRGEVRRRLRGLAAEKELEARAQRVEERLAIARELHDVLAHTITAISVQASAAADGVEQGTEEHATLRAMRTTAQEAMAQLASTIALLRSDPDEGSGLGTPDLQGLDALAATVRTTGIEVELVDHGVPGSLPRPVQLAAYRIVQEALTNVLRHADARTARVCLGYDGASLTVNVSDDGRGARNGTVREGHGIVGMRERAEELGGHLRLATDGDRGFEVEATLPAATPS